ncbi:hypothetical protein [Gloeothece verrucosa]|uniref:hypothetical protein n=1 Tax=Gloeothece verrucosa TaxID=2546359 RepID=UPI000312349E|nr:hypothetical protein [Gloeothece verrucosa]
MLKNWQIFKFSENDDRLLISAYNIAYKIAIKPNQPQLNPLQQNLGIRAATVNFISDTEYYSKIKEIKEELTKQLQKACGDKKPQDCLENICTPLSNFNSKNNQIELPFSYPFSNNYNFISQRLIIENSSLSKRRKGSDSIIKAHVLNVKFQGISQFNDNLLNSLRAYIDKIVQSESDDFDSEELKEVLTDVLDENLNRKQSELTEIKKIIDTESLPRLLRDIKIDYLDYLKQECAKTNLGQNHPEGFQCLEALINRLSRFLDYINKSDLEDSHYEVTYLMNEGDALNLRTAFSQADAFDKLPIIPQYEGVIGESVDKERGIKEFNLGLNLKFNNSVNTYSEESVIDYYMNEIDPKNKRHIDQLDDPGKAKNFKKKVLMIACLYYFIFAVDEDGQIADKDYDPSVQFEAEVLNKLKPGAVSDEEVKSLLEHIKNLILNSQTWRVREKLDSLKKILQDFLKLKEILLPHSKTVQLCLNKDILKKTSRKIITSHQFFRMNLEENDTLKAKAQEALAYMEVMPDEVNPQSLTSLSVTFTFDDVRYFKQDDKQNFSMKYDLNGIKALPVVFVPGLRNIKTKQWQYHDMYLKDFQNQKLILINYKPEEVQEQIFDNSQSPEARIYRQVFTLLTYLCISVCREPIILDSQKNEKLFIPLFRFHLKDINLAAKKVKRENKTAEKVITETHENEAAKEITTEDEEFLSSLSKALAHILRRDCLADAQGLNVKEDKSFTFRVQQAMSSLYSLIPKTFEFKGGYKPQLDKLAMIVVSSWLSDAVWNERDKADRISNIYGEITVINRISETTVKIEPLKTFADNQPHSKIYSEPEIVRDEILKLYEKGYRDFLFIAKAPYSRSLGITKLESDPDSLFFMDQKVIQFLKQGKEDIKLYPIFMDTYPAINLTKSEVDSLYIPDTEELEKLSRDKSQQTRVFLNLFTGRTIDKKRRFYNSVVCYSSLLNIYDVADTKVIMQGLLDKNSPLQQTLIQYITLFHFSRYEMSRNLAFKLDPYSKLIGDKGIGTVSTYNYSDKNVKFNNLAFLTSIRSALYGK